MSLKRHKPRNNKRFNEIALPVSQRILQIKPYSNKKKNFKAYYIMFYLVARLMISLYYQLLYIYMISYIYVLRIKNFVKQ